MHHHRPSNDRLASGFLGVLALVACLLLATPSGAAMTFVHPGALDSEEELLFVKAKIAAGAQPWTAHFARLKMITAGGNTPLTEINSTTNDADFAKADARRAYANALAYRYTGQETYATKAINTLNDWSGLEGFVAGTDQDRLLAGWLGALFAPAAELMRSHPRWAAADVAKFQDMFRKAFYPKLTVMSTWNGNVDLTQIDAMMSIAVFNEDEDLFKMGLSRLAKRNAAYFYLADSTVPSIGGDGGNVDDFWSYPTKWVDGLTQETCRDNNHHAQYAMASAIHAAEVAWHQGVDVYTAHRARFTSTMELMAKQIVTGSMQGTCPDDSTTKSRFSTFEIGYNHYRNRMGIDLPNTLEALTKEIRPKGTSDWNIFFETLTHADVATSSSVLPRSGSLSGGIGLRRLSGGRVEVVASRSGPVDLLVTSLDGRILRRESLELGAGESRSVDLSRDRTSTGLGIVRASAHGQTVSVLLAD